MYAFKSSTARHLRVQAVVSFSRLPAKVMCPTCNLPCHFCQRILSRLSMCDFFSITCNGPTSSHSPLARRLGCLKKGNVSLPVYRCARGSTLPESFPLHRQPVHPWYSNRLSQCPGRNTVTASSCISRFWSFLPMKALAMLPLPVSVRVSTEYGNATVKSAKWTGHMQNSAPSWIFRGPPF